MTWIRYLLLQFNYNYRVSHKLYPLFERLYTGSGGFRRKIGATAPFHDENSAWHLLFSKKGGPYPDPNALFFQCFVLNVGGGTYKLSHYSVENPENISSIKAQ